IHKKDLPVSAYTDAGLIEYMDTAGLGTVATRTGILQTLIDRKYVRYSGGYIIPTRKGLYIYETVRGMKIADPALTSGWETQLAGMEQGKLTQEEFLEGALKLAGEVTEEIFRKYQK
ncbi:MAG: DNA topoisomerase, partial [Bacteroides ovatus]|nr:DNA topoisomerase [Bacteroides ovatus]